MLNNMVRDADGLFICPHNNACRCSTPACDTCGWNPAVQSRRVAAIKERAAKGSTGLKEVPKHDTN